MEYRRVGDSDLKVSLVGLGGNTFGKHFQFGKYNTDSETIALVGRAAELGITLLDTADMYADGDSERYIGRAIHGRRHEFVIASKVGMPLRDTPNEVGLSRKRILKSVEGSLARLQTDYLDIYYAHRPDPHIAIEETLSAFEDLVRQGKVRHIACSNFAGWQIADAQQVAAQHGYVPFLASQSPYNLLERGIESEIIPCCEHYGMGIVAYWPLAQGVLTGKYRMNQPIPKGTRAFQNRQGNLARQMSELNLRVAETLAEWAGSHGRSLSALAIAWLAAKPIVCSILTGVTSIEQLESNVQGVNWTLTSTDLAEVEQILQNDKDRLERPR